MTQKIKTEKFRKTNSHVTTFYLQALNTGTISLEVAHEFVEKEFTDVFKKDENGEYQKSWKDSSVSVLKKWEVIDSYPMTQVTVPELIKLRLSKVPGVVYKKEDQFFYAQIPGTLDLNGKQDRLGKHLCGCNCSLVCNGCPKVAALTVAFQQRFGKNFPVAVRDSWRIEKYDFIREGLETFNMNSSNEAFMVLVCESFQTRSKEQRKSKATANDLKLSLANFVWEDANITSIAEMRTRIARNYGMSSEEFSTARVNNRL